MGRRAFEWIARHEDDFFAVGEGEPAERKRLKYAGELGLIAGTLMDDMPEGRALLARAWEELDRGERVARLLSRWPIAATTYLPFLLAGRRSPQLDESLRDGAWVSDHTRFPPFARFAIGITLGIVGVTPPWDEAETVLANRFFARPTRETPPIRAELLAHAVMWRSGMGRNPAGLGRAATARYREVSPDWHRVLVEVGLLDPLGEIVVADLCSRGEPPPASLAMICAAQRDDGAVPPRLGHPATAFEDLYHTTCVAALAGRLSARSSDARGT
jgi:Domain of unknown function (DUF6895)